MDSAPTRAALWKPDRLIIALLMIAALAPFAGTLAFGYVMDDTTAIRSNPDVDGWESLLRVWTHPYGGENSPYFGLYRPLTMALFAFVWNAGGHWALWFHLLAVSMHIVATVLVWRLLEHAVGRIPASLAALWFAIQPVHVEAVANVANSSEILVAIWTCLLALYLVRVDARSPSITWAEAAVAGALYLAALLSKESGAVAPVLAALWVWGGRRFVSQGLERGIAAHANRWWRVLAAWSVVVALVMLARSLVLGGPVTGEPIAAAGLVDVSAIERVKAMLSVGPKILRLLAWPSELNPHYGPTTFPSGALAWSVATMAVLVLALGAGIWLARKNDRRMLVAIAWIVVAFLPASNILVPTGQILAERTLYVPSIGFALLVALVLDALWDRAQSDNRWRIVKSAVTVLLIALVVVAASRTRRWTEVWKNHETLFAQMIAADSAGYRGYWLSGLEARGKGRSDDALSLLGHAYTLYPRDRGLMIDYSETLLRNGQPERAASVASGLMSSPRLRSRTFAIALYLDALANAYGPDSVIAAGRRLMRETPSPTAALYLGRAHEMRGDTAAAASAYREGLRVAPADSALLLRLNALRIAR